MAALRTTSPRKLLRVVRRGVDDVVGRGPEFAPQPLGRNIDPSGVRGYYCDFRHKARYHLANPLAFGDFVIPVAQAALGHWELMLDGLEAREHFLERADWLVRRARPGPGGQGMAWYNDRPLHKYDLAPGWITAMGQGQAISVLLRAHSLTRSERYLALARAAFVPMALDIADGGAQRRIDGHLVLEEYATAKPAAILNGWIFALFGLHELATVTRDSHAQGLFEESFDGLIALLPRYDVGWWSLYSLYEHGRPDLAKPFYQRLHPVLLMALDMIRPRPALRLMAARWLRQIGVAPMARLMLDKVAFRVTWERNVEDRGSGGCGSYGPTATASDVGPTPGA